jgi:hypothetical protein
MFSTFFGPVWGNKPGDQSKWVVPEKIHTPPTEEILPSGGGGETKSFLIIVNVLGHPKGVGGLTSNFLRGGGMDVFWNDPMPYYLT